VASLEFNLDPADAARLAKRPGFRAGRSFPIDLTWHDTADGVLASEGLALCASAAGWQLSRLAADTPAGSPTVLADARRPDLLNHDLPGPLVPLARLHGVRRTVRPGPGSDGLQGVELHLLDATMPGHVHPGACRLTVVGPAALLTTLSVALAGDLGLRVPQASLAETVLAPALHAATRRQPVRPPGAPQVSQGQPVTDSLAMIAGRLLDVMLHWAALAPTARTPEAVHQMRVATRRLRSALSVFRTVAACPELAALAEPLKLCAAKLGAARDWDVFIEGIGGRLAAAFPDDRRCAAMLRGADRRRRAAYADLRTFISGPEFRTLSVALACTVALRPWDGAAPPEPLHQDTNLFAASVLARRLKQVNTAARGLRSLPTPALHELRKDCKKLRYAAEFFSSLFPQKSARRFLARLADLQEALGLLNDSAAVSGLMAQLGRVEQGYAAGLVEGFSAAAAEPARTRIMAAWKRFREVDAFWVG
jgi:triphosphatase